MCHERSDGTGGILMAMHDIVLNGRGLPAFIKVTQKRRRNVISEVNSSEAEDMDVKQP